MVPGFSNQHLCNRDLTKIRVPKIRRHNPHDSRSPNPHLAEVPGQQRASQPVQDTRKTPPPRGAGYAIVLEPPSGSAPRPAQWRYRAPSGSAMRSAVPATRKAAGAPSAWSQPSQSTNTRPRRWCDAGPPGRQSVTAAQKAGAEGTAVSPSPLPVTAAGNPTKPDRPALSGYAQPTSTVPTGRLDSPPPQCPPNLVWT